MKRLALAIALLAGGCATLPPVPPPSAQCHDGSFSYSAHQSGTCGGQRGGVAQWLADVPP
jgi:hypothetical protein